MKRQERLKLENETNEYRFLITNEQHHLLEVEKIKHMCRSYAREAIDKDCIHCGNGREKQQEKVTHCLEFRCNGRGRGLWCQSEREIINEFLRENSRMLIDYCTEKSSRLQRMNIDLESAFRADKLNLKS
ncbi:hypothetical protein CW304_19135 [Bacillus sp. UFRGS-B20]|nr:hypothetical protein CW304_19135 [Bacillus sp. UFRGS-B20]